MEASTSIDKAVDVLFHLHQSGEPQGVTAIGRALSLPKSSAHRLLASLAKRDLVEQDAQGRYRPGFGLAALGLGVLDQDPIVAGARRVLESEAAELGETCFLVSVRAGVLTVMDKVEGRGFLRVSPRVGAALPLHATAVGKLYLAFAPELVSVRPARDNSSLAAKDSDAQAFTPDTLLDRQALDAAVADARRQGWASNRNEWVDGLSVVAAPVHRGKLMVGAVAVACSSARFEELGLSVLSDRICKAGDAIGRRLSGTGPATTRPHL